MKPRCRLCAKAQQDLDAAFPPLSGHAEVITFDWLGRQFAVLDPTTSGAGTAEVSIVDVGSMTIEGLVEPENFLDALQVPSFLEAIESDLFDQWRRAAVRHDRVARP